jgi:hypothetical protein
MPTIFGKAPDLKRWDASIKYRFWTETGLGLDFGLSWAKGAGADQLLQGG